MWRFLTSPAFTVPLYTAVLVLTHLTGFQQAMATHMWIHDAETLLYLITGYLLFLPLVGSEATVRRIPYLIRFVILAATMGVDTLVGVVLMLTNQPLAPGFAAMHPGWGPGALADQQTAGAVMWFGGDGLMMLLMIITAIEWGTSSQADQGLGSWLEGIRRRELLGDQATERRRRPARSQQRRCRCGYRPRTARCLQRPPGRPRPGPPTREPRGTDRVVRPIGDSTHGGRRHRRPASHSVSARGDRYRRVLGQEMQSRNGDLVLAGPGPTQFSQRAGQQRARVAVDEQFRCQSGSHPPGIPSDDIVHVRRLVHRRESPEPSPASGGDPRQD